MGNNPTKQKGPTTAGHINDYQFELDPDYGGIPSCWSLNNLIRGNSNYEVELYEKYKTKHMEISSKVPKLSELEIRNKLVTGKRSISEMIALGFKNKQFGKPPGRTLRLPACYYKMHSIDDKAPYENNVLVVGPGMCGSAIYHQSCGRNIFTVGPLEGKYHEELQLNVVTEDNLTKDNVSNLLSYLNTNVNLFVTGLTLENDAMGGYKSAGPVPIHYPILDASFQLIKQYRFTSVVHKIFLNDNDMYYNTLVLKMASYYNTIKLLKPEGSSYGTTERYLVLSDRRTKANLIDDQKLSFLLALMKKELISAYFELKSRSIQAINDPIPCKPLQCERISDYRRYMIMETESTLWYIKMIWDKLKLNSSPNLDAFREYSASDNLNIVKRIGNGKYAYAPIFGSHQVPLIGEYDVMFDGNYFVETHADLRLNNNVVYEYSANSKSEYMIVIDAFRLFQCYNKLKVIKFDNMTSHSSKVVLIEGVPGCGKTYEIVHTAKDNSLVLSVTKSTSREIAERMAEEERDDVTVSTVDSFILHNVQEFKDVYIDEGLMLQPGEIDVIAIMSKAENVYVYGDRRQLNFIPRVAGFVANIDTFTDFASIEYRNVSRRCPQDIARIFFSSYDAGFYTTSDVVFSVKVKRIATILNVEQNDRVKYLVFTQAEKKDMLKYNYNVNTIHEVQGMTFEKVALVRLNPKQMHIYDSDAHILVACTRHTKEFTYYTTNTMDKTCQKLENALDVNVRDRSSARTKSIKASKDANESAVKTADKYPQGYEAEYYIDVIPEQACKEMSSDLHKELYNELYDKLFYLIRPNDVKLTDTIVPVTINKPTVELFEGYYPDIKDPAINLQSFYEDMLDLQFDPTYNDFDEYQFEHSDMYINVSNIKIDMLKLAESGMNVLPNHTYTPVLRTNQPNLRAHTAKQSLAAIDKRNCNAMNNAIPINMDDEINITLNKFLDGLCIPEARDMLADYSRNPVSFTQENLYEWVRDMRTEKTKNFDCTDALDALEEISRYGLMIKDDVKNKLEPNSDSEYLVPATIVHHRPVINAIFGPIFKRLFDRFTKLLSPRVMCLLKKNSDEIHQHLNNYMNPQESYQGLEIDFEKFDKSQLQMCHELEMIVYQLLGLDQFFLSIWKIGHYKTSAKDFVNGIVLYIMYQRKSGDTTTCFGNTLISMLALSRSVNLQHLIVALFIGDDSFMIFRDYLEKKHIVRTLSDIFNLSAKMICKEIIYMCSAYIINTSFNFVFIPDPLKRIEKLGKKLYFDDEKEFIERHKSFKEMVKMLKYEELYQPLIIGMTERCKKKETSSYAYIALWSLRALADDYNKYRALWVKNDSLLDKKLKRTNIRA